MDIKKLKLKLLDPFDFEDEKEIKELDLSGLMTLTAMDICAISDKMMEKGYSGQMLEVTPYYAILAAARAMGKPWEYCNKMGARDTIRLKNFVANFLYTRGSLKMSSEEETSEK